VPRALEGRVAAITGAGRGLGREHALFFGLEGARVVVNDLDAGEAEAVAAEINGAGGDAVALPGDAADWETGRRLVATAVEVFGDLHVLVNNAGIVRDRFLVNLSEQDWDEVVRVHLKGTFVPTRWAANHWRAQAAAGSRPRGAVVNTTSTSGLGVNPGQANYGTAKAGVAAFTRSAAAELARYGVRVNAVAPLARTRLTESVPALAAAVAAPADPGAFDEWHPANVSPLVVYLAMEDCPLTGEVFLAHGGRVQRYEGWSEGPWISRPARWTVAGLAAALPRLTR